jgi:hypothetical protein
MQVERRLFQIAMAQQQLNGAQVGARFQQMRCEAVPPPGLCRLKQSEVTEYPPGCVLVVEER